MVAIIVPFRSDGAQRDRNWKWLEGRYRTLYPDWEVVEGQADEGQWCKGTAVRNALTQTQADRLVISDADMILADEVMWRGVRSLTDHPWVVPHTRAWRLTDEASVKMMDGSLDADQLTHDDLETIPRRMYPCGGLFFCRREAYESIGGFDERFFGWGGEDEALGMAFEAKFGKPLVLGATLIHLYHQPQDDMPEDRRRPESKNALVKPYEEALG